MWGGELNHSMTVGLGFCIYDYYMSRGFEPVSFRVAAQDATTELQDIKKYAIKTSWIIRTNTALLAQHAIFNSSDCVNLTKISDDCMPCMASVSILILWVGHSCFGSGLIIQGCRFMSFYCTWRRNQIQLFILTDLDMDSKILAGLMNIQQYLILNTLQFF